MSRNIYNLGDTLFKAATTSASAVSASEYVVTTGVTLVSDVDFSFGNRNTITHKANNATDGFPVTAGDRVDIPAYFFENQNLQNLYVISSSGTANIHVFVPSKTT